MSNQPSLWDIPSVISSLALEYGVTHSDVRAGVTTGQCGPEAAPVLPLAQRAKGKGLQTLVTSGLNGYASSESAALESCLVSRLMERLDTAGSTLFQETWKRKATPLRRRYWAHTARGLRTSGSDCTSVPTPRTVTGGAESGQREQELGRTESGGGDLQAAALLAAVPTPQTHDDKLRGNTEADCHYSAHDLSNASILATVATPRTEDSQCAGAHPGTADTLHSQANLSAAATPAARDYKSDSATEEFHEAQWNHSRGKPLSAQATLATCETGVGPDGSTRSRLDQLPRQAQLADSGLTATGGTGETVSTGLSVKESPRSSQGQLNAAYSRWLQGIPVLWDYCAILAMRNLKNSKRGKRELGD